MRFGILFLLFLTMGACTAQHMPPLATPAAVDLQQYMGTWYSIASIPKFFEKGCRCTQAEYTLNEDKTVTVRNSCLRNAERDVATGTARLRTPGDTSRLEVSFFGPFWGEYTIIHVSKDYEHAVVGAQDRDSLWILSRKPDMNESTLRNLENIARKQGFDISRLRRVDQNCD